MLYILVLKICLKYFKPYIQMSKMSNSRSSQELNISLWNLFLWIQCPRIGVGDRNSYFYHQMLFSGVILLNMLSKMLKIGPKSSFLYFPLVYSLFRYL